MRLFFVIVGITGLILMSIFSLTNYNNHYPSIKYLNENPEKYDGILTEQYGLVDEIKEDSFILASGDSKILVKANNIREPTQGSVNIIGVFNKEGFIKLKDIHYSDYNNTKYFVSIIGLIMFLFIFFREWRITLRGFKYARLD
ncbi:hypothetical protein HYX17_04260 [Candidatus Woesearchaeota archaeon]|nr:hypothetical protein [Candidatus Woesearchaeota archaeon]